MCRNCEPEARYNQDAVLISEKFSLGVDLLTVVAETVPDACTENYAVMESIDRFAWNLRNVDGVQQVITLPMVAKVVNAGWNEGNIAGVFCRAIITSCARRWAVSRPIPGC